ncbi:response regulator [Candidatus Albibeggiatoa sp. nov. NOAA]|uniref:response regulator n=1 Tax=Candidatus Albibeggiatoa sp. nov. NOAA TaxID=3162724 RepID=UPI0032FE8BC3|nr:response regulator [Thiotrichaceae bacterium]
MDTPHLFKILIVDDNKNNLFTLRTLIDEHINVDIVEADSGQKALSILMKAPVDLIIMDVQMPEMDGFETAIMIQSIKKTQHIPIVFLTAAYKSEEFQAKGFAVGAADYLTKPIDVAQLISRIKMYLRFIEQEQKHTRELEQKVQERTAELLQARNELEQRVVERTSELAEANAELERLGRQNFLILETAGDGICGLDLDGYVSFINPAGAEMLGYEVEELIGVEAHDTFHHTKIDGDLCPICDCHIFKAVNEGYLYQDDDDIFWRKDGSFFPIEYKVVPLYEDDEITGAVLTFNDITEHKKSEQTLQQAKEEAEQANFAKSCFLANMSHELRTPLNAIIGYSEILEDDIKDEIECNALSEQKSESLSDLNKIQDSAKHLLHLINDILDVSKIEAGKMTLFNETFDAVALVQEVLSVVHPLIEQKNNTLEVAFPSQAVDLFADQTKVRQILLNLLSNAGKFTENGTVKLSISIETVENKQWGIFSVIDTGIGLTSEQQSKLFEAFTQADVSTTRKYGGTGLGLTISEHFAGMMGGFIEVKSQINMGSTFSLHLPLHVGQEQVAQAQTAIVEHPPETPSEKPTTVLVIEDDANIRELLQRYLNNLGHQTLLAENGIKGIQLAEQYQPDAITLDVMLPEKDGWSILSELKSHPKVSDIPVIMLSVMDDKTIGYSLGVSDYLVKPINQEQLAATLNKYLPNPTTSSRILVVEDHKVTREMMEYVLTKAGWQVDLAENGQLALDIMAKQTPSLILSDLMMPEMDGFEFIEHLRENPSWAAIPVIVLTAKELMAEDRARLNQGAQKVFQKSAYNQETLLTDMRKLLTAVTQQNQT